VRRIMTISGDIISNTIVSLEQLFPVNTQQFLKSFESIVSSDIHEGMNLDFEIENRIGREKISPVLRLARPEDAEDLVRIYKELYDGTYPYKEMEDINEVRKMIQDPNIQWIVYQEHSYQIAGCITFVLDFDNRRGYIRGFMLKKKYQGYIDITKAMIGSMIGMIHKFKNKIYVWYVENRTAHAKSQYSMEVCGIHPIGFYPNKDVFLGKVESDLMQICYDERALKQFRLKKIPEIIPEAEVCYLYSENRYNLGDYRLNSPNFILDAKLIHVLKEDLKTQVKKDKFGYETIRFCLPESNSFFEFLYTPQVQNFEKTKYRVNSLEELYVFAREFIKCGKNLGIRYCELFTSAYRPDHQKIFHDLGLNPRGYIPSWMYNREEEGFEDSILFNWCRGEINSDIQLIEEGKELVDIVMQDRITHVEDILRKTRIIQTFPMYYTFKERLSTVWNYPKVIKSSLMTGLIIYLLLVVGSIVTASYFGYRIIYNSISQLGTIQLTPVPLMFDGACVLGGMTTIFLYCNLSRRIIKQDSITKRLLRYGMYIGSIGSIGIIFVGIFSLDRAGPSGILHNSSSILAFGGFVVALSTYGATLCRKESKLLKIIGGNGFIPLIMMIGNCIFPCPIMEWILLFTILTSLIPLFWWVSFR
jgi:hypothetical protein